MRVGFIGTGNFATQQASVLKKLGIDIVACYGTNPQKTADFCKNFSSHFYESPYDFISKKHIDALYIIIPPFAHDGKIEIASAKEKIPFFCEKPIGLNLFLCQQVLDEIKKNELITSAGYLLRYDPIFEKIKMLCAKNKISTTRICSYSYMPEVHWWRKKTLSGGMLTESGTHYIDLLRFLFGEITSLSAISSTGIAEKNVPECDIEDSFEAIFKFSSGMIGSFGATHLLNTIKARKDLLEIYGQNFALHADLYQLRYQGKACFSYKENQDFDWSVFSEKTSKEILLTKQAEAFFKAIQNDDASLIKTDYEDALKTSLVVEKMNFACLAG